MLVIAAMNLGILTVLFFIVGMIKPQWGLFFMDKPSRFIVLIISTISIMVSFTMYGEGHRRGSTPEQWTKVPTLEKEKTNVHAKPAADAPVPVPAIKDTIPDQAPQTSNSAPVAPAPSSTTAPTPAAEAVTPSAPATENAAPADTVNK